MVPNSYVLSPSSSNTTSISGPSAATTPDISILNPSLSVISYVQKQMMLMLTESFSKLFTVSVDKQGDAKTG